MRRSTSGSKKSNSLSGDKIDDERETHVTSSSAAMSFTPPRRIPVIGMGGGSGSGTSAVANWVADRASVLVLNADTLGHEALQTAGVKTALRKRFSDGIFGKDGEVVRSALAREVFGAGANHRE